MPGGLLASGVISWEGLPPSYFELLSNCGTEPDETVHGCFGPGAALLYQ